MSSARRKADGRSRAQAEADSDAGLASATVGEHLLQVHEGPIAVLACFVRGVPPSDLAAALQVGLENLHRGYAAAQQANVDFDWNDEASRELEIAALSTLGQAPARQPSARWPVVVLGALVLLLLSWVGLRQWQLGGEARRLRDAVAATPGWQLLSLQRDGHWSLRLLRDPDAAASGDLATRAGIAADQLVVEEIPYLALDDAALARRLARALSPPPEVRLVVVDGIAKVSGSAPAPWVAQLTERAPLVAGVRGVDSDALVATPDPALDQEWQALRDEVERVRVLFVRGGTQVQLDTTLQLAAAMRRALELGRMLRQPLSFQVQGWSDEGGSEQRNLQLRARRAEALRRSLLAAGIDAERITLAPDDPEPNAPSAGVRWIEGERR